MNGAGRVVMIESNWRLDYVKSKYPKVELIDYSTLPKGQTVYSKLREMCPRGPDVALECVAGEYARMGALLRASTRFGDRYFGDYQRDDHLCPELRKMWCHWRLRWLHKSLQHRIIDGAWYPPDW